MERTTITHSVDDSYLTNQAASHISLSLFLSLGVKQGKLHDPRRQHWHLSANYQAITPHLPPKTQQHGTPACSAYNNQREPRCGAVREKERNRRACAQSQASLHLSISCRRPISSCTEMGWGHTLSEPFPLAFENSARSFRRCRGLFSFFFPTAPLGG